MTAFEGEHIWIIGASSGIGRALAQELSHQGALLCLSARDKGKLEDLNHELGGQHRVLPFDVMDRTAFCHAAEILGSLDRVVYMAAAYEPMSLLDMNADAVDELLKINMNGPFHLIYALSEKIKKSQLRQIALCGSVAGYVGLPNGQPYSATKAAMINLAETLRSEAPSTVDIKLISPGFVRTPLTDKNNFEMPMMIEPKDAAIAIAKGLRSSSFEIHFPKGFTYLMKLISALPYALYFPVARIFGR